MKTCLINSAMATVLAFVTLSPVSAFAGGGNVQPPNAKPAGYSLTDMAEELAYFSVSGNDPAYYPDTPFQILSIDYGVYPGPTTFQVKTGTRFFVPIVYTTDTPIPPTLFPDGSTSAARYFFDPQYLGAHMEIEVDGDTTCIGPMYVAGPVSTPGLADGGSHFIQVGAFLTPFTKGTHTVTVRFVLDGDAILDAFGEEYAFDYTYIVKVK